MGRNRVRLTGVLVLSIAFGAISASVSSAAPTVAPSPSISGVSFFQKERLSHSLLRRMLVVCHQVLHLLRKRLQRTLARLQEVRAE